MGLRIIDKKTNQVKEIPFSVLEEEAHRIFTGDSAKSQELRTRFIDIIKSRRNTKSVKDPSIENLISEAQKIIKEQPDKLRDSQVSVAIATLLDLL
jgi:hypothetical protein